VTLDKDLHLARALLVEGNALLRNVTAGQLRDIGVGHVATAARLRDARVMLERERYDIVVCSREFEGSEQSGQDLLDELRRERLLSPSTVFLMVVEQATYHQVVEAAEASLDALLVRPYNALALAQRLAEARQRKRELADVLRALDAGETEVALVRAVKRFGDRAPYWNYCGRVAAELMLVMKRPDDAALLFDKLAQAAPPVVAREASRKATRSAAAAAQGLAWARLGVARSRFAAGDIAQARRAVQAVIDDERGNADAHDLMGRILVEQCEFDAALEHYRSATQLTPGCLLRQQHTGALAFYQGQAALALEHLDRALALGVKSSLFDALTLLLVAMLRHDQRDAAAVGAAVDMLRRMRERHPSSLRLERFERSAQALHEALLRGPVHAAPLVAALAAQAGDDAFDLEAAAMLLALAQRLSAAFATPVDYEQLVQRIGRRFAVSKAITEVLVAAAGRSHPATGILQGCHGEITERAERAMDHALRGAPGDAVKSLLASGEQTQNLRLIELARSMLKRHAALMPDASALAERAAALSARLGHAVNHIAGIQRSGRAPGAMHLRGVGMAQGAGGAAGSAGRSAAQPTGAAQEAQTAGTVATASALGPAAAARATAPADAEPPVLLAPPDTEARTGTLVPG
jgi:tetratricopeptide (TPR) repeat protein